MNRSQVTPPAAKGASSAQAAPRTPPRYIAGAILLFFTIALVLIASTAWILFTRT